MNIREILTESLSALYSIEELGSQLVLKGGTALTFIENIDSRLSTDIDFSIPNQITDSKKFFAIVKHALTKHFAKLGYEVFDFNPQRRPSKPHKDNPPGWGGWKVEFKLILSGHNHADKETLRRNALMPEGHGSTKISLEISENEYCGLIKEGKIGGVIVRAYDPVILVLEKIRAICQQHKDYPHKRQTNRARDYFDIYQLSQKYRDTNFLKLLGKHIDAVFEAKLVDKAILLKIFEDDFLEYQENGFEMVKATISIPEKELQPFDFYVDHLRFLLEDSGII